jgi:hypothetical protein
MKEYGGLGLHERERGLRDYEKGAKSRGIKPRNKIILFLSPKSSVMIYPKFLREGNELPSGGKVSSLRAKCQKKAHANIMWGISVISSFFPSFTSTHFHPSPIPFLECKLKLVTL